ncbi:MAG: PilX N-terminal domain-containing pilus assembly protein [Candidatus Tectimicrobiota bacterium]
MMPHHHQRRREDGAALVISLLMLAVLLILGSGALTNSRVELQIASNDDKAKRALITAEYGMSLGEDSIEQVLHQLNLGLGHTPGHYVRQPPWHTLTWDDRDSIDVGRFFAVPGAPNPANLPPLPPLLRDAHELPRIMLEEKFFKRHSLTTGQGAPKGISYFNVTAHGGRAKWTAAQRPGATHPTITYNERYPDTRIIIQSTYAKRYN